MDKNLKLLILEGKELMKEPLAFRMGRTRVINTLSAMGVKVRHDSGSRLIIIDVPKEKEAAVIKDIPGARLIPIEQDMKDELKDLNPDELLFLGAIKKRVSKKYRDDKKNRKPGDSPEEKLLLSGSCVRDNL